MFSRSAGSFSLWAIWGDTNLMALFPLQLCSLRMLRRPREKVCRLKSLLGPQQLNLRWVGFSFHFLDLLLGF